jgi:DNA-directed RNA polymerase I subunit RPA1
VNEGLHIQNEFDSVVQGEMNIATSKIIDACLPDGLRKNFPKNNMNAMVLTGAKGGKVNRSQIACLLGQQELEGMRVPRMPNGKTLPCFTAFDPNPRASGFISDRFITGLRPQDFYFHCMAGREGLVDTAVKTARSGYLQRCLVKQLESLVVSYDMTVRDNDGSVVQFLYGEDGIDATEMLYLDKFDFLQQNHAPLLKKYFSENIMSSIDTETVFNTRKQQKEQRQQGNVEEHDPILSIYNPSRYLGSTSEKMYDDLKKFCKKYNKEYKDESIVKSSSKSIKAGTIEKLYYLKYYKSLVHPGENVGTLAAQGIGEPSTQMTLNTFHLAGHGGANVTLGIPRLREILMTASENLKTPLMILPVRKDKEFTDTEINNFSNKFQKLQLSEVINNVKVNRDYMLKGKSSVITKYDLTFEFEDLLKVEETFGVNDADLKNVFTTQFLPLLMKNINKQTKKGIEDSMAVKGKIT